jgi:rod shape-determining protein MreD
MRPRRFRFSLSWMLTALDRAARASAPAGLAAVLMVVATVPPDLPSAVPALALGSVLFWTLFRPAAMGPAVVFGLGLLQDLLTFAPLGVGILTLLLSHAVAMRLRRLLVRQRFLLVWLAVAAIAAAAVALGYVLNAGLTWSLPPPEPAAHLLALTIGLYPPLALLLTLLHRRLERAEGAA